MSDGVAFVRVYFDIPSETKEKLKRLALDRGVSQKKLLADLIEEACNPRPKRSTTKRSTKRGSKKKQSKKKARK